MIHRDVLIGPEEARLMVDDQFIEEFRRGVSAAGRWLYIKRIGETQKSKVAHYFNGPGRSLCQRATAMFVPEKAPLRPDGDPWNCRMCRNIKRHQGLN